VRLIGIFLTAFFGLIPVVTATAGETDQLESLNPFAKSYIKLELVRNYPEATTKQTMAPSVLQPNLSYLHIVSSDWIMVLGGGLKTLERMDTPEMRAPSRTLAIYSLNHETLRVVRLTYPYYLLLGVKVSYLLPSRTGKPPPLRDPIYPTEIGLALSAQAVHLLSQRTMLSLRVDRWRGVNSSKLAGMELAIGIARSLE
jgi:hypothetical protein